MMTELANRPAAGSDALATAVDDARRIAGVINANIAEIMVVLRERGWVGITEDDVRCAIAALACHGETAWPAPQI